MYACEHLRGVPLLVTHADRVGIFSLVARKFSNGRELLPTHPNLFVHRQILDAFQSLSVCQPQIRHRVEVRPEGLCHFGLPELLHHGEEIQRLVAQGGPCWSENTMLKSLWRFIERQMGQQIERQMGQQEKDSWFRDLKDWKMLPVNVGPQGHQLLELGKASRTISMHSSVWHDDRKDLEAAASKCRVYTVQEFQIVSLWPEKFVSTDYNFVILLGRLHEAEEATVPQSNRFLLGAKSVYEIFKHNGPHLSPQRFMIGTLANGPL